MDSISHIAGAYQDLDVGDEHCPARPQHKFAKLTPERREEMARAILEKRITKSRAVHIYGLSYRIVRRWALRFLAGGPDAMADRPSRARTIANATPAPLRERVVELGRQGLTLREIVPIAGVSLATASRILKAEGLARPTSYRRARSLDDASPYSVSTSSVSLQPSA